jgi:sucrose-6-phosphate hydrolase SacC (GH32 family)
MTLPLELGLKQTDDGPRMTFQPVQELQGLRAKTHRIEIGEIKPGDKNPLEGIESDLLEIQVEFDPSKGNEIVLNVRDVMVEYHCVKQELSVAGQRVAAPMVGDKQRLTIYCDRTGVEVFASEGTCYLPMPYTTRMDNKKSFLEVRGGPAIIDSLVVHELKSAWVVDNGNR